MQLPKLITGIRVSWVTILSLGASCHQIRSFETAEVDLDTAIQQLEHIDLNSVQNYSQFEDFADASELTANFTTVVHEIILNAKNQSREPFAQESSFQTLTLYGGEAWDRLNAHTLCMLVWALGRSKCLNRKDSAKFHEYIHKNINQNILAEIPLPHLSALMWGYSIAAVTTNKNRKFFHVVQIPFCG